MQHQAKSIFFNGECCVSSQFQVPQPLVDGVETDLDDELDVVESSPDQDQLIVAESITDSEVIPPPPLMSTLQMPIQMVQQPPLVSTPASLQPSIGFPVHPTLQSAAHSQVITSFMFVLLALGFIRQPQQQLQASSQ